MAQKFGTELEINWNSGTQQIGLYHKLKVEPLVTWKSKRLQTGGHAFGRALKNILGHSWRHRSKDYTISIIKARIIHIWMGSILYFFLFFTILCFLLFYFLLLLSITTKLWRSIPSGRRGAWARIWRITLWWRISSSSTSFFSNLIHIYRCRSLDEELEEELDLLLLRSSLSL